MSKNGKCILVIEDDRDTLDVLVETFQSAGYDVLEALNGEQGLKIAESDRPDLIVLDLMLPGMDGVEVCRELTGRDITRGIPVIILTARSEMTSKLSSFMAGAKRFITKPFEVGKLLEEVERTFRQAHLSDAGPGEEEPA